ncbi:MAG: GNAT family N-acetyltransferase [Clostridia bacterium]|nr:GNAT family N-acetyltransferase [Clostridia bacterium]
MNKSVEYRMAQREDIGKILFFIKELAEYEKMADHVVATEELLTQWLFERKIAEVIFAVEDGEDVGFALFFYNFSTFLGRGGIYLEDLFVLPHKRGLGYGKGLLNQLAKRAVAQNCGRLEWACLNWNQPSIDFYLSLNAVPMNDWKVYRLEGESLLKMAE